MRSPLANAYLPLLVFLAAVWGASYLFIKVAVEDVEPAPMMAVRTLGAGALLFAFVASRGQAGDVLRAWRPSLVLGVINAALPFWLIAWGEKHIDSSVAGIAQASVPVFVVLISAVLGERFSGSRLAGIAIGLLGVAVLTGLNPHGGWWAVAGTLAVVASSLSYAGGGVYGQRSVKSVSGPVLAAGSMLAGGLVLLPSRSSSSRSTRRPGKPPRRSRRSRSSARWRRSSCCSACCASSAPRG